MKNFLTISTALIALLFSASLCYGQSVGKWTFSAMQFSTANDSLYVAAGQIMSGQSLAPNVLHGYYPLQYSLLSVPENTLDINIYPNPFTNELRIELSDEGNSMTKLEVRDLQSKLIFAEEFNGNNHLLNTAFYAPGVYILTVRKESHTIVRKIIKQ